MKENAVTQVCGDHLIQIQNKSNVIVCMDIKSFSEGEKQIHEISLPPNSNHANICFFYPILNESKTYMAMAICYGHSGVWKDDKYQGLIVVDLVLGRKSF